ncbi:hypothetical protein Tco_0726467 [Tanacetum coccineum]|uniref:Uncharacterized protein n=1 Tax=Tanacetum coccineum TaxID=301880 RepID=A0ABQ4YGR8_9ASTR
MLFGLVLLGVVFGPRLVAGAMISLNHKRQNLSSVALSVLTTQPACHSSLALCLSLLGESLPSVPDAYGQSLKVLLSQPAASESESRVPDAVSE